MADIPGDDAGKEWFEVFNTTDRLINIVNDLLIISGLEKKDSELNIGEVSIPELLKDVLPLCKAKAAEKNLQIIEKGAENLPVIEADYFRLQQVFINLIDNAVKLTAAAAGGNVGT